jgi:AcrR family transcriptional regulator
MPTWGNPFALGYLATQCCHWQALSISPYEEAIARQGGALEDIRRTKGVHAGPRSRDVVGRVREATLRELDRAGYAGLTMEGVALAAGVNRTTLYRRWPKKSDLVGFLLEGEVEKFERAQTPSSLREALEATVTRLAHNLTQREGRALGQILAAPPSPELRELANRASERAIATLRAPLQAAMDQGEIAPTVDIEMIAYMLFFGAVHWTLAQDASATRQDCERLVAVALKASGQGDIPCRK